MKKNGALLVLALLTAFGMRSQDAMRLREPADEVCFPFWMAREMALELVEKDRLQAQESLFLLQQETYKSMVAGLEENLARKSAQVELVQQQKLLLDSLLRAERLKKPRDRTGVWLLRMAAAVGLGWLLGAVM